MLGVLDSGGDPALLSADERLSLLERIRAEQCALDAVAQQTLAAIAGDDISVKGWAAEEVACVLQVSPRTAPGLLHEAAELVGRLPRTLDLVADATITLRHARVLIEATRSLDAQVQAAVETRVLRIAAGKTVAQFRQAVHRAVASLDRRGSGERHEAETAKRRVRFTAQADGMSEMWAWLPLEGAALLADELDRQARARARALAGLDGRTLDQRRADALVDLARECHCDTPSADRPVRPKDIGKADEAGGATDPADDSRATGAAGRDQFPGRQRLRDDRRRARLRRSARRRGPRVQVVVPLSTLLGLDDAPGEVDGDPVPAATARRLAAETGATWRRILTDTCGQVLDVSPGYRPAAAERRFVRARDRTCCFPGCRRRAVSCEIDHRVAWPGGPTCVGNLHALCARHHHLKHEARGWWVRTDPDGSTVWTTPTGRTIRRDPEPYEQPGSTDGPDPVAWPKPDGHNELGGSDTG